MRRVLAIAVWIALSGVSGVAAAPTLIAPLHAGSTIESFGGVAVWSDYNATDSSWHLVVDSDGLISTPPVPAATRTIEADVGPGPSGAPLLVYKLCRSGCDLVVSGIDGSDPRTVPGSDAARDPTIWGDRVAWVRGANQVMTSLLDGSARRTLRGTPRRVCQPVNRETRARCEITANRSVTGLQLHYGRLALTDSFYTRNGSENGQGEVLTEPVKGGPQRLIALEGVEEGGGETFWLGPSWSEGDLYFYADGLPECVEHCIYVYGFDPRHDTYVRATESTELTGFSMAAGHRAYEATAPGNGVSTPRVCAEALKGEPAGETLTTVIPCVVRLSAPIAFRPTRPPISFP
ncbi:MAG: hypothetical protein ACRDK7_01920 [Solirubrobacteraceae bacterium]